MSQNEQNIVQAEFFLAKSGELSDVVKEVFERSMEGSPSILVLRFRDEDGAVTRFTRRYSLLDEISDDVAKKHARSHGIMKFYYQWRIRVTSREKVVLMERRADVARKGLVKALSSKKLVLIAIKPTHEFRILEENEVHETLESVRSAKHAWIFVFPPNKSLDADDIRVLWSA